MTRGFLGFRDESATENSGETNDADLITRPGFFVARRPERNRTPRCAWRPG